MLWTNTHDLSNRLHIIEKINTE